MRLFRSVVIALLGVLLLGSCSLFSGRGPILFDDSYRKADARMEELVEALDNRDRDALKEMFSPYALEKADDIDGGLEYLLSFFPDGDITWTRDAVNMSARRQSGDESELLRAYYEVVVDGQRYWLFFADFTINEVVNPDNVGIFAIGIIPWSEDRRSGATGQFFAWAGAIQLDTDFDDGYPGVYVPEE